MNNFFQMSLAEIVIPPSLVLNIMIKLRPDLWVS